MSELQARILADLEAMAARDEDLDVPALIAKYRGELSYGSQGKAIVDLLDGYGIKATVGEWEYKDLGASRDWETKVLDEDRGIVEAIVSVTGVRDLVDDIIVPGAYTKTLAKRKPVGFRNHNPEKRVAKALEVRELMPGDSGLPMLTSKGDAWPREAGALYVKMQYNLENPDGAAAFSDVKFYGEDLEWSIGYHVPRMGARLDHKSGTRHINELDLFEFSDVPHGANALSGTLATKALLATEEGYLSPVEILHNESLWMWA